MVRKSGVEMEIGENEIEAETKKRGNCLADSNEIFGGRRVK